METLDPARTIDAATSAVLRAFVQKVSIRDDFAGAILFGSRARHSHHPESDADVAILLSGTPGKFVQTKLELDDLAYEILLETGMRIQPLPVWQSEWEDPENYSNPHLLKNIVREGIRL
ncbi:MAG: nucleotidyltransferase domain-containing protein [Burkholderiaceae bacterium]